MKQFVVIVHTITETFYYTVKASNDKEALQIVKKSIGSSWLRIDSYPALKIPQ